MINGTVEIIIDIVCVVLIVITVISFVTNYASIPDQVPTHYGFSGEIDSYGPKSTAIILPVFMVGLFVLLKVAERHPKLWNTGTVEVTPENAERIYGVMRGMLSTLRLIVVVLLSYLTFAMLSGGPLNKALMLIITAALFADVAFWMVMLYRNR